MSKSSGGTRGASGGAGGGLQKYEALIQAEDAARDKLQEIKKRVGNSLSNEEYKVALNEWGAKQRERKKFQSKPLTAKEKADISSRLSADREYIKGQIDKSLGSWIRMGHMTYKEAGEKIISNVEWNRYELAKISNPTKQRSFVRRIARQSIGEANATAERRFNKKIYGTERPKLADLIAHGDERRGYSETHIPGFGIVRKKI